MTTTAADEVNTAKVSAKGWVVIPASLRRRYHIEPGQELRVVDYGGVIGLVPPLRDPVRDARGMLAGKTSLASALREERRRERESERR